MVPILENRQSSTIDKDRAGGGWITFVPWYHVMSGGGTEYRLISHVRLMVLPAFTKTADSPSSLALAAAKERSNL